MSQIRANSITNADGTGAPDFPNGATGLPNPFGYTSVSGTTQALDVGAYNFFDAGTLAADTTISFTNLPTEAQWTYTAEVGGLTTYDLSAAVPVKVFRGVSNQAQEPEGLFFKSDGAAMYVVDLKTRSIHQYTLSTEWDISTAVYTSKSFDFATQDGTPHEVFFKPDGTRMYMTSPATDNVFEYTLSTAWDVSTASYVRLFYIGSEETSPGGLFFKPDGTKMFIVGSNGDSVDEYTLSTAWDISTASPVAVFSVNPQESAPSSVSFTPDGTKMFMVGTGNDSIFEYSLSTAWSVSTASYVTGFKVALEETTPHGIFLKPDGTKMYMTGAGYSNIAEYSVASAASITLPTSVQNLPQEAVLPNTRISYTFYTFDGGTTVHLINEEVL